jgi:hypothetical protein
VRSVDRLVEVVDLADALVGQCDLRLAGGNVVQRGGGAAQGIVETQRQPQPDAHARCQQHGYRRAQQQDHLADDILGDGDLVGDYQHAQQLALWIEDRRDDAHGLGAFRRGNHYLDGFLATQHGVHLGHASQTGAADSVGEWRGGQQLARIVEQGERQGVVAQVAQQRLGLRRVRPNVTLPPGQPCDQFGLRLDRFDAGREHGVGIGERAERRPGKVEGKAQQRDHHQQRQQVGEDQAAAQGTHLTPPARPACSRRRAR